MTPSLSLRTELAAAVSIVDLAQRLGRVCVENERELIPLMADPRVSMFCRKLAATVATFESEAFAEPEPGLGYLPLLDLHAIEDLVETIESTHGSPLVHLAFLRGLCDRPLRQHFDGTEELLSLGNGMPIPFAAKRPIPDVFPAHTPSSGSFNHGKLLEGVPFTLFKAPPGAAIDVEIDYGKRERLDEVTWRGGTSPLPRVATVHPQIGSEGIATDKPDRKAGTFFGVRPRSFDLAAVLLQLRTAARDADIAVLPELSLPPDEVEQLATELAAAPRRYPPLVVAGSAHVLRQTASGEVRANESRIYLDGTHVATHSKIHPYATRALGTRQDGGPLKEAITPGAKTLTLLGSTRTRLAVVICSDLVDRDIVTLLMAAGVNLLLVPSLTFEQGSFNGAICVIASFCQGVAVVVNADLDPLVEDWRKRPFRVMAAVPQPEERQQSRSFPHWFGPRRPLGIFDPNRGLRRGMRWL